MDPLTLIPNNSLQTETPEEGRQMAIHIARLIIKLTRLEPARHRLSGDAGNLSAEIYWQIM